MSHVASPLLSSDSEPDERSAQASFIAEAFQRHCRTETKAITVAAIETLTEVVENSEATTMMGLEVELKAASDQLKSENPDSISLAAGCDLFNRYVTRTSLEIPDFEKCKARLIERGTQFAEMSSLSRKKVSEFGDRFIHDGDVILVHGPSQCVASTLVHAARKGKFFSVILTECRHIPTSDLMAEQLIAAGVPVTVILDSAVAFVMEKVSFVLVGAEGVVESGGIINLVGTYTVALVAKSLQTPFYVAAESYKFVRLFPLTQGDVPQPLKKLKLKGVEFPDGVETHLPRSDYTPPDYITLLFSDLGILTPSAVSDELVKLFR